MFDKQAEASAEQPPAAKSPEDKTTGPAMVAAVAKATSQKITGAVPATSSVQTAEVKTATATPPTIASDQPLQAAGTASMPEKQYGAGDIYSERKKVTAEIDAKRNALKGKLATGEITEAEFQQQHSDLTAERQKKVDGLAALSKKAEGGQFASQAEMDTATGRQPQVAQAVSAVQPPLPQPQPVQVPPSAPVEVPGLEKLVKAQEQQATQQQIDNTGNTGKAGPMPNIRTDFDDTMLVLMCYDRT